MRKKSWNKKQLREAVKSSRSIRQILSKLGLKEAGGNYSQIKKYIKIYKINNRHFTGRGWNKGKKMPFTPRIPLNQILVNGSNYQSHKLKKRLFRKGLKKQLCENCGWKEVSEDGRIPLELDHINGIRTDNRLHNLRILCPNCHSLQSTHRGKNSKIVSR